MGRDQRKRTLRAKNREGIVTERIIKMEAVAEVVPVRCSETKCGRLKAYDGD